MTVEPRKFCLLTGYPGYLGSCLYRQLSASYEIHTLGMDPANTPNHIVADLAAEVPHIADVQYDLVIHAAGKAHSVPKTDAEKSAFYRVNHQGTVNLLRAIGDLSNAPRAAVIISTVAVYGKEEGARISENEKTDARDPYGESKLKAEEAFNAWNGPGCVKGVVRLPLIVGQNAPGNLGQMVKAIQRGRYFDIAGGKARRSFVWITDVARFISLLAAKGGGLYNVTDGADASFAEMHAALCCRYNKRTNPALPALLAYPMAWTGDAAELVTRRQMPFSSRVLKKMTSDLTFSCEKAMMELGWRPLNVLEQLRGPAL